MFHAKPAFGHRLNQRHDLARCLVGYWPLNEAGGEWVHDVARVHGPGTLHANSARLKWAAGYLGMGLLGTGGEFNSVAVPVSSRDDFANGDRISISLWVKRETTSFTVPLASKDSVAGRQNWSMVFTNSNSLRFSYYTSGGFQQTWESDGSLTGTDLRHIVLEYVFGTAGSIVAYTDGALLGATGWTSGDGAQAPDTGSGSLYLGYDTLVGGGVNGWLFSVAIWKNRLGGLTRSDVTMLARNPYVLLKPRRPLARGGLGQSAALSGTVTAAITEADIVAGGKTIVLTLSGDTFVPN